MANLVTNKCKFELFSGDANLDVADMRMLLLKSGAPTAATNFVSDLTPGTNEIAVSGYARQALAGESITEDDALNFAYLDATDPNFPALAAGETVIGAVLFRFVSTDANSPVYAYYDVTDTPTNGGDIGIVFSTPANGAALKGA